MSMPVEPPPLGTTAPQEPYNARSAQSSVGPVVAVLAVIVIMGVLAGVIGRVCYGRKIMCRDYYDFECWVERKCSACIDGRINSTPSPSAAAGESLPSSVPVAPTQENPPPEVDS